MQELKLIALDVEDLAVVSAQLQDAVVRVHDIAFLKGARQFAMIANRFNWLSAISLPDGQEPSQGTEVIGRPSGPFERRRCAVRFAQVDRVQLQNIDLQDKRRVLSLLAISYTPDGDHVPEGSVELIFSGGAAIRLHVECVECELRDLGAAWSTRVKPKHDVGPSVD